MAQHVQIGLQLASLRQPFKKALHTAAQLGAETLEINARNELRPQELSDTGLRQVRKMLNDLNLRVSAVSFPTRRGYQISHELDRRLAATQQAMQMAYQLGADVVVNHVGHIPSSDEGEDWNLLVESLLALGQYGERVGTRFAAATGTEPPADLKRLINALPDGCVAVDLNPGSLVMHGFPPRDAVQELGPYVAHVHARDGMRDEVHKDGVEVPVGAGAVDFPELFALLEMHRFRGAVVVQRDAGSAGSDELAGAIQFLKQLRT